MIRELDSAVVTRDLPDHHLKCGDVGTVVLVHDDRGYEVEFVTLDGDTVAVLSLSPATSERLLAGSKLVTTSGGPLADTKKPLAAAVVFNFAGLMDALTPWIDLVVREAAAQGMQAGGVGLVLAENATLTNLAQAEDNATTKMILDQVHTVIEVLKCYRTTESATYLEDGVTVTHSLSVFKDVQ